MGILSGFGLGGVGNSQSTSENRQTNITENQTLGVQDGGTILNVRGVGDNSNVSYNVTDEGAVQAAFDYSLVQSEQLGRNFQDVLDFGNNLASYNQESVAGAYDVVDQYGQTVQDIYDSALSYSAQSDRNTADVLKQTAATLNNTAKSYGDKVAQAYANAKNPDQKIQLAAFIVAGLVVAGGVAVMIRGK